MTGSRIVEGSMRFLRAEAEDFSPGSFALVMATGIVSIAAFLSEFRPVAWALLWVNVVTYAVLWLLTAIRFVRQPAGLVAELTDHARGAGFFAVVAGTCVLGIQVAMMAGRVPPAVVLWGLGVLLWILVSYAFLAAVTLRRSKPGLEDGVNGTWLLAVVATQSVSILGAQVASRLDAWREGMLFVALAMHLHGAVLYILIMALIFYRFTFFRFTPETLTPPYWINMGAVAITALAGANLLLNRRHWALLSGIGPFLQGSSLLFWVVATWWIPLLLILGYWRHVRQGLPLRYDPQYWGLVFPLGMYSVCTFQVARAGGVPFLLPIAHVFVYIALLAWLVTALGLIRRLMKTGADFRLAMAPSRK